jgi:hypothetical protein
MRDQTRPGYNWTALGLLVFFAAAFGTVLVASQISNHLFLAHHYGWNRWWTDSLTFVETPKGKSWLVSNGDRLPVGFGHFCVSFGMWVPLFWLTLWGVIRVIGGNRISKKRA